MFLKIVGAVCIVAGCGAVGFRIAAAYRYEEKCLRQLLDVVSFMQRELSYRMTALPILCRQAAGKKTGAVYRFFIGLAEEMEAQIAPDVARCCCARLEKHRDLPPITTKFLKTLGENMGAFDLDGQIDCINSVKTELEQQLELHCKNKDMRIRSYQTLGLCAGAAIAILFL